MSNLLYWVIPVVAVVLIGLVIAFRERKPLAPETSIEDFSRRMNAISSMRGKQYPNQGERKQAV